MSGAAGRPAGAADTSVARALEALAGRGRRELLANLVARDLKSRYKGSLLGFLWTILTPLFMAGIYVFFLRLLAGRGVPLTEILIGVFAWQFTVQCVQNGLSSITGNSNLVKKVYFPRVILPAAATAANLVGYLLSLVVQFVLVAWLLARQGQAMSPWVFALPLAVAHHALFNFALALLLAAANVYFRDTQHLVGVGLGAWFFLSPVMYNLSFLERFAGGHTWIASVYLLNPLAVVITAYRALVLPGVSFPWNAWSAAGLALPLVLLAAALGVFQRAQRHFADQL